MPASGFVRFPRLETSVIEPPPSYRRAFLKSGHHAWLAILTLGLGFASGEPLGLLAGGVLYALGWIFVPDFGFFRRAVDARHQATQQSQLEAEFEAFRAQQEQTLRSLSPARRRKHEDLVAVCRSIEAASAEPQAASGLEVDSRRRKLDELTWTYLRMLGVEQSLEVYLETERREQLPDAVRTLEAEIATLTAEVNTLKEQQPRPARLDGKERLLTSRLERLATLNQRLRRIEQAANNHDLLRSEQERLVEQVKLIRADAIASRNADTLTARIDLSIEHLATTNKWLSELADFKDLTAQMPPPPPPSPASASTRTAVRGREAETPPKL